MTRLPESKASFREDLRYLRELVVAANAAVKAGDWGRYVRLMGDIGPLVLASRCAAETNLEAVVGGILDRP